MPRLLVIMIQGDVCVFFVCVCVCWCVCVGGRARSVCSRDPDRGTVAACEIRRDVREAGDDERRKQVWCCQRAYFIRVGDLCTREAHTHTHTHKHTHTNSQCQINWKLNMLRLQGYSSLQQKSPSNTRLSHTHMSSFHLTLTVGGKYHPGNVVRGWLTALTFPFLRRCKI